MPSEDDLIEAAADGKAAYRDGHGIHSCPYATGTEMATHWRSGWRLECSWQARERQESAEARAA